MQVNTFILVIFLTRSEPSTLPYFHHTMKLQKFNMPFKPNQRSCGGKPILRTLNFKIVCMGFKMPNLLKPTINKDITIRPTYSHG